VGIREVNRKFVQWWDDIRGMILTGWGSRYWDWTLDIKPGKAFANSPVFSPTDGFGGNGLLFFPLSPPLSALFVNLLILLFSPAFPQGHISPVPNNPTTYSALQTEPVVAVYRMALLKAQFYILVLDGTSGPMTTV